MLVNIPVKIATNKFVLAHPRFTQEKVLGG